MAKGWNPESPLMRALTRVFDLMLLNVLFLVTSIPVITIGASLCAMHYCLLRMVRNEEGYIIRSYLGAFRENLRQATVAWLLLGIVGAALVADYRLLDRLPKQDAHLASGLLLVVAVVWLCLMLYVFPLLARFENTLRETFKNALVVSLVFAVRTVVMLGIVVGFAVLYYNLPLRAAPVLLLFGFSFPAILTAYVYTPILRRMESRS